MVKIKKFAKCKGVIDEQLCIMNGDQNFFAFLGDNAIYSLARSIHPGDIQRMEDAISSLAKENMNVITLRMVRYDGQYRWMLVTLKNDEESHLIDLEMQDIAEYENTIDSLKGNNDTYTEYFSLMEYLMISYNMENDKLKIFMLGSHQQINFYNGTLNDWKMSKINNGAVDPKSMQAFEQMCEDFRLGKLSFECELKMSLFDDNDKKKWCLVKGKTINDMREKNQVIATMSLINPVNNSDKNIPCITVTKDAGTDLLNKRTITNYAKKLIDSKPNYPVTIAIIDIDDFKSVNDGFGHMFGDEVITNVADIIKNAVEGKGISGRIGGDEMFIILENFQSNEAIRSVLRTIRNNVEWMYARDESKPDITCSIGSASYPEDASDYESLFKVADKMLYLAKEKGRNRYIIYQEDLHGDYVNGRGNAKEADVFFYKYRKNSIVNEIVNNYCINKIDSCKAVVEKIALTFGLDSIFIYRIKGSSCKKFVLYGEEIESKYDRMYLYNDNYISSFREDNVMVIDNVNFFERKLPTLFNAFREMHINQAVQIDVKQDVCYRNIVSFNRRLQKRQWGESDIIYLSILGNILGMRLEQL